MSVTSRSCQGHLKVTARSRQPTKVKIVSFCCFLLQFCLFEMSMMVETYLGPNTEVYTKKHISRGYRGNIRVRR